MITSYVLDARVIALNTKAKILCPDGTCVLWTPAWLPDPWSVRIERGVWELFCCGSKSPGKWLFPSSTTRCRNSRKVHHWTWETCGPWILPAPQWILLFGCCGRLTVLGEWQWIIINLIGGDSIPAAISQTSSLEWVNHVSTWGAVVGWGGEYFSFILLANSRICLLSQGWPSSTLLWTFCLRAMLTLRPLPPFWMQGPWSSHPPQCSTWSP